MTANALWEGYAPWSVAGHGRRIDLMATSKSSSANSRKRTAVAAKKNRHQIPLASSPAKAKREEATLEKGREQIESAPTAAELDVRTVVVN